MTTIRDALASARPHVPLKQAWRAVIQHSRSQRRNGIERALYSRSLVERFLQQTLPSDKDIGSLKTALRDVLMHTDHTTLAQSLDVIDVWVDGPSEACPNDRLVQLAVSLGEAPITSAEIDRWLGTSQGAISLPAIEAAKWLHHLNGRSIAGERLTVKASCPDERPLPRVARKDRARLRSVGQRSWLPHLDDVGRFSATPKSIAELHANHFQGCSAVVDPFCGAGADAIAIAMLGATVFASDSSPSRVDLARTNAEHFGVRERMQFKVCDAEAAIHNALQQHQCTGIFLDPPWGGTDWDRTAMSSASLFKLLPNLTPLLDDFKVVVVKLPRTFPVRELGSFGGSWEFQLGIDSRMSDPVDQLKTTIAVRHQGG